jgi:hypothetical protein
MIYSRTIGNMDQDLDQEKDFKQKKQLYKKQFYKLHTTGMLILHHTAAAVIREIFLRG